jgi:hypothetical protein
MEDKTPHMRFFMLLIGVACIAISTALIIKNGVHVVHVIGLIFGIINICIALMPAKKESTVTDATPKADTQIGISYRYMGYKSDDGSDKGRAYPVIADLFLPYWACRAIILDDGAILVQIALPYFWDIEKFRAEFIAGNTPYTREQFESRLKLYDDLEKFRDARFTRTRLHEMGADGLTPVPDAKVVYRPRENVLHTNPKFEKV